MVRNFSVLTALYGSNCIFSGFQNVSISLMKKRAGQVHVRKKVGVRTSGSIDFGPKTVVFDKVREKRTPREERWVGKAMPNGRT